MGEAYLMYNIKTTPNDVKSLLGHKVSGPVLRHWKNLIQENGLARRKNLDPVEFFYALPHICILNYVEEDNDYCMSIRGGEVPSLPGGQPHERTIRNYYDVDLANSIIKAWNKCRDENIGLIVTRNIITSDGEEASSVRLILPISDPSAVISLTQYAFNPDYYIDLKKRELEDYKYSFFNPEDLIDS